MTASLKQRFVEISLADGLLGGDGIADAEAMTKGAGIAPSRLFAHASGAVADDPMVERHLETDEALKALYRRFVEGVGEGPFPSLADETAGQTVGLSFEPGRQPNTTFLVVEVRPKPDGSVPGWLVVFGGDGRIYRLGLPSRRQGRGRVGLSDNDGLMRALRMPASELFLV